MGGAAPVLRRDPVNLGEVEGDRCHMWGERHNQRQIPKKGERGGEVEDFESGTVGYATERDLGAEKNPGNWTRETPWLSLMKLRIKFSTW